MTVIRSGIAYILHLKSYDVNIQTGEIAQFFGFFGMGLFICYSGSCSF